MLSIYFSIILDIRNLELRQFYKNNMMMDPLVDLIFVVSPSRES